MSGNRTFAAVILAAGQSNRMGSLKPLLRIGSETMIERIVRVVREAGVDLVQVVLGYGADRLIPLLDDQKILWVLNEAYDAGMYSTVQAGVRQLERGVAGIFILPGDMPLVRGATLRLLMGRFQPGQGEIVFPCLQGRRGHPPLLDGSYRQLILDGHPPGGLRSLLAQYPSAWVDLECDDPGVLFDVDTPEDYRRCLELIAAEST
jgi:molybdenum cofactor cytidylyltransferase